jgi:hypothetical protein
MLLDVFIEKKASGMSIIKQQIAILCSFMLAPNRLHKFWKQMHPSMP